MTLLPAGWFEASIGELGMFLRGVSYPKNAATSEPSAGTTGILRAGNLQSGRLILEDLLYVPDRLVREEQRLRYGDIVFAMSSGSASVVGKASVVSKAAEGLAFGAFCGLLRPHTTVAPLLAHFFQTREYRSRISALAAGVNINNLRPQHILEQSVQLPPLNEQRRIVAKLEAVLARNRKAKETLEAVPALLERFRQSVLASAFRGDLTRDWREKNPNVEPASKLLERIRVERRRRWEEAELEKLKSKGKVPKDDKWKAKYEVPVVSDSEPPFETPSSWDWASLDTVALIKGGLALGKKRTAADQLIERPYLRVANVQRGHLDLSEMKFVKVTLDEARELELFSGDVLFNEGGDRDKLGRGWVWAGEIPQCIHQNHVFRARPVIGSVQAKLLSWYGNTFGQQYFIDEGKQTTNLASVSMTKLKSLPVPVMPAEEQLLLVERIDTLLAGLERVEETYSEAVNRLHRIDQSLLAKAFRGELVAQSASDEPASMLLERIRADRERPDQSAETQKTKNGRVSKVA